MVLIPAYLKRSREAGALLADVIRDLIAAGLTPEEAGRAIAQDVERETGTIGKREGS